MGRPVGYGGGLVGGIVVDVLVVVAVVVVASVSHTDNCVVGCYNMQPCAAGHTARVGWHGCLVVGVEVGARRSALSLVVKPHEGS